MGVMMLRPNMPSIDDQEGSTVPVGLPPLIDAHVHIFPSSIFSSIRKWFDENAWHIRYQLNTSQIFNFLLSHGVKHVIALQYAHKPGIAQTLNQYMVKKCRKYPKHVTGMATVYPGEKNSDAILQEAFDLGLGGLKLHAHVQCFDMNSDEMKVLYDLCQFNKKPVLMHVGREPKSAAYSCDPYQLCSADKLEQVLNDFPDLKICVPHMGFDEVSAYRMLLERYDNLWLDTTMVLTDYFPIHEAIDLGRYRLDRVMYGSDFPNIPYAWDREIKWLHNSNLSDYDLGQVFNKSAVEFYNLNL